MSDEHNAAPAGGRFNPTGLIVITLAIVAAIVFGLLVR
jgi:hypothetical protein